MRRNPPLSLCLAIALRVILPCTGVVVGYSNVFIAWTHAGRVDLALGQNRAGGGGTGSQRQRALLPQCHYGAMGARGNYDEYDGEVAAATLPDLALLLVFEYVAADNLDDLVSAGQVCRHWRRVASSAELWCQRRLKSHTMATQAFTRVVAFAPRLLAMDVCWINQISPEDRAIRKRALLDSRSKLSKLTGVMCHRDSEWTQELLARQGPHLRELEINTADRNSLEAIARMPRLSALHISAGNSDLDEKPFLYQDRDCEGGLERLEVRGLPKDTTISLLRAHRKTLRKLTLNVGTPCSLDNAPAWPTTCNDLMQVLQSCGLSYLQEVTLTRYVGCHHTVPNCMQQIQSLECLGNWKIKCGDCSPCSFT